MPLYSDSEALDTIIKYLAILIPDIFALGRKWTRKWSFALCNSTKVQFLGNPLTLGINADKSIIFEAEQINKLRFGMYAEPMKRSCYYFYSLNYVWFSLLMWVLCARSEGTKMDKSNEYGFGLGLSFTSVNSRVQWINLPRGFCDFELTYFFHSKSWNRRLLERKWKLKYRKNRIMSVYRQKSSMSI